MPRSAGDPGLAGGLRALAADALELAHVRLELFSLEAREAFLRLVVLVALAVGSAVAIGFGLSFLAVFVIVLLWDTHRLWALGVFAVVFLAGGCVLLMLARACLRGLANLFAATRGEWQHDRERLGMERASADPARTEGAP
ncbi:MAG: phage holin family protein [Burkholderiaceae bacterium]|jgi:uncharacterized membrane protein YqjE|nr:phage holin family protein [Burkholderiaceae bacterium]